MATDKTFAVTGVSTVAGKTKIRFANDVMRIKILAKNGHTDIELVDLPHAMTKGEIAQHMNSIGFAKGQDTVPSAIDYIAKKNPVAQAPLVSTTTVVTTEAVTE